MLMVFTGSGKGKTTAAVGQAIRARGQGQRVVFAQFMKRPDQAGEQNTLRALLPGDFMASGPGFLNRPEDRPGHRAAALELLAWIESKLAPSLGMLILDEALYALNEDLVERPELEKLLDQAEKLNTHVLLTGRGLPAWLQERADLVTEMTLIKHPYNQGRSAEAGIEF